MVQKGLEFGCSERRESNIVRQEIVQEAFEHRAVLHDRPIGKWSTSGAFSLKLLPTGVRA
jgi:hypothetical protein